MKKIVSIAAFILVSMVIHAQDEKVYVKDSHASPRKISGPFSGISVSGSIDIYISQSDEEAVVVSATDAKYRDKIITEINNGILNIYYQSEKGLQWNNGDKKLKAYVSFKNINRLSASGASDVFANGVIKVQSLELSLSGSSDFKGAVDLKDLTLHQSGSSDSHISGRADKASIHVSGSSDVKGYDLVTEYCEANASGASDIQLTINKELNANASGSSDIYYRGTASIKGIKSSGSSTVKRAE